MYEFRDELNINFELLGIALLLTGFISLFTFMAQYCLWRNFVIGFTPLKLHYEMMTLKKEQDAKEEDKRLLRK